MGVPRSAKIALAALLAGSVAPLAILRARAEPVVATAAVGPSSALSSPALAPEPQTPATGPDAAAKPPGATDPPSVASAPSDPQAAAIFARLAESGPLLPRFGAKEREAMRAFYALGAFRPVWIVDGGFTPAARAVATRLAAAGEDGLDARAYPVPVLGAPNRPATPAEIAEADLKLSAAVALYARDARGGRVNPGAISRLITPTLDLPAADTVLSSLASAGPAAGDLLQRYNPNTPGYLALKTRLAAGRGQTPSSAPSVRLPPGPPLRLGMRDARVPLLRARFGLESRAAGTLDAGPGEPEDYDAGIAAAVAAFQRGRGIPGNGVLNAQTIVALGNADLPARGGGDEGALLVNMERWRWLPSELGPDYVLVNVPEYRLRVFRNGTMRDETRVIVGKTESPTPLFSGMMEYAVVNPSWYVPPSILKTMLASGRTAGYEVVRHGNQTFLRQPPGERNALGFIKFMFPNSHAVYLHDTPNRSLFARSDRALSHGCVRVDDPFRFADSVLPETWTSARLKTLIGKGERTIRLDAKLPVHLAYFTAYVDDLGSYRTLPDLYGYDGPMRVALGLPGGGPVMAGRPSEPTRRVAVLPIPKPKVRHLARRAAPAARASAEAAPDFGEPGLWTPRPAPVSRYWW